MKIQFKATFGFAVVALLLVTSPITVMAQDTDSEQTDESVQTTVVNESTEERPDPARQKERIDKRKADLKITLNAAKQARLKSRCKASQGKLQSIQGRIKGLETSRTQVHANTLQRLTKLSEKLAAQGIDVSGLESQITEISLLVEAFNADVVVYKEAVVDLATMDCVADPTAFQASLEAARTARTKASESSKAIRTYLKDTIRPTLTEIKKQLPGNEQTEASEGTN